MTSDTIACHLVRVIQTCCKTTQCVWWRTKTAVAHLKQHAVNVFVETFLRKKERKINNHTVECTFYNHLGVKGARDKRRIQVFSPIRSCMVGSRQPDPIFSTQAESSFRAFLFLSLSLSLHHSYINKKLFKIFNSPPRLGMKTKKTWVMNNVCMKAVFC